MKIENFTYLLAKPQRITASDLATLDEIIKKYPYFQSARALQLKGLKNQDSFLYNDALKLAAAHTTDRDILFEYITSEKFIQHEISQNILQHDATLTEIKVVSENISEQQSFDIEKQLKAEMQKADDILDPNLFQRKVASVTNLVEKIVENPEAILQPNKPLKFTKDDTHSFAEWLKLTNAKPIERASENTESISEKNVKIPEIEASNQQEKVRNFELIDKFIQQRPKIIPSETQSRTKNEDSKSDALSFSQTPDSLMTETLAKVYLQQKNYKKAIQAYKILILKNPEKSGFFADRIRAIEKLINTEQS